MISLMGRIYGVALKNKIEENIEEKIEELCDKEILCRQYIHNTVIKNDKLHI